MSNSKSRKGNLTAVAATVAPEETASIEEPTFPKVKFADWTFEIHPISDRTDAYAYDDSAEFLILAVPLATKLYAELIKLGSDNPQVAESLKDVDMESPAEIAKAAVNLVEFLIKLDTGALIKEVADTLPGLAAIACHFSDPDVMARDIKEWTKSPLNAELWHAVVLQLKAENIFAQLGGLQGLLGEFSSAAA